MPALLLRYLPHIIFVATIIGGILYFGHTRYDAGYTAAEALWQEKTKEAAEDFAKEIARQQALLEATGRDLAQARRDAVQQRDSLDETFRKDPIARAWADTPIPDGVQDRLRGEAMPSDPVNIN